jgi:hypothetical protein
MSVYSMWNIKVRIFCAETETGMCICGEPLQLATSDKRWPGHAQEEEEVLKGLTIK